MKESCILCKVDLKEWIYDDSLPSYPNCDWFVCSRCGTLFSDIFLKYWKKGKAPPPCDCQVGWEECDICAPKEAFGI